MLPINIRDLRLQNQHLVKSKFKDPVDVVRSLVAVQAQDYYGAKWALGQRTIGATDTAVESAFAEGRILRLHVMRPTWHFVTPEDIRWLLKLTAPRINAVSSSYFRKAGLDQSFIKRTNRVFIKALQGGHQLTRAELRQALERAGIAAGDSTRLGYIVIRAELDAHVCSGARRDNKFTYALLDERAPQSRVLEKDEALAELAQRYFTTRGPASVQDYVWWSGLTVAEAKRGIEIAGSSLKNAVSENKQYFLSARLKRRIRPEGRAHLLPTYDEYFIGYKDRSAGMHPQFDQKTTAAKLIFHAPLVMEGIVIGGWNRVVEKEAVTVNVRLFKPPTRSEINAITREVDHYAEFLRKEVRVLWS